MDHHDNSRQGATDWPLHAAWLSFVGLLSAKIAVAAALLPGGAAVETVLLRVVSGCALDVSTAALVFLLGWLCLRVLPRRAALVAAVTLGVVVGLLGVLDVAAARMFGTLLSRSMIAAYAGQVRPDQAPREALIALGIAVVVFFGAGLLIWAVRPRRRTAVVVTTALLVLAAAGRIVDDGPTRRAWGLSESPWLTLLRATSAGTQGAVAWDAPWSLPSFRTPTIPLETPRGRPRHVIIWLAESTGTRYLSLFGAGHDTTPNLVRLRDHSLRFTNYVAPSPISIKAIVGLLCGLHPLPDAALETTAHARIACPSLPETLTARGYDAALFHGGYFAFTDKLAFLDERGFEVLVDGENHPRRDRYFTNGWGIDDAAIVDEGLRWLDGRAEAGRPSLSVYIPLFPHYEYFLPPGAEKPFGDGSLQARYENGLRYADAQFGRLVDAYRERGLLDDTLFVFVGDHGEAFDQHPRNRLHGSFLYEENIHAPLAFFSTRLFARELVSDRLGSHADVLPTILDLLGLPVPTEIQGQSLVADRHQMRGVPLATFYPEPLIGFRSDRFKLIHNLRTGVDELFDLDSDPDEQRNVAEVQPGITAELRSRAVDFHRRQPAWLAAYPHKGERYLARVADKTQLPLVEKKVFNMKRRCLAFRTPAPGTPLSVGVTGVEPMPRFVGVGIDDESRFAKLGPIEARVFVDDQETVTLAVSQVFERSSAVRAIPTGASVRVELRAIGRPASGCLWFAP